MIGWVADRADIDDTTGKAANDVLICRSRMLDLAGKSVPRLPVRTSRRVRLAVAFLAVGAVLSCLVPAAFAAAPPSVTITSPSNGASVEGTVAIEATASSAQGEPNPGDVTFDDGAVYIGEATCEGQPVCKVSFEWHATGLSGVHTVTATVHTEAGSATSAPVTVNIVSPPPTVVISSPDTNTTVEGTVPIKLEAATNPSQEDYPTHMTVHDGVNYVGEVSCEGQRTCDGEVRWKATGLSGEHTLTATVYTHNELSATSAPVLVHVVSPPPTVSIVRPSKGAPLGGTITIEVKGATNPSQEDYPTSIAVHDGANYVGEVGCQGQPTCSGTLQWKTAGLHGVQGLTATIHTHREVNATSAPVYVGPPPGRPHAKASCGIAKLHIRRGRRDDGSCSMRGVPAGTRIALQYRVPGGSWRPVTSGTVLPSGHYLFFIRIRSRSTIELSVLISANRRYAATRISVGRLHVS